VFDASGCRAADLRHKLSTCPTHPLPPSPAGKSSSRQRMDSGAKRNNEALFHRMDEVFLKGGPDDFIADINKLAAWLGDEKAYYQEAKPFIIRMFAVGSIPLLCLRFNIT
jgi:hypothetical protein